MRFLLQLELAALPMRPPGAGILQLFYCATDDGACETWSPTAGANLARLVDGALVVRLPPDGLAPEQERSIVDWEEIGDVPNSQEHEELGLHFDYDFAKKQVRVTCPEINFDEASLDIDAYSAEAVASAEAGDKLFGWPHWVQGAEYPSCPRCNGRMNLVFQVDSEQGVDVMFGDLGVGHITQCPKHPDVLAFGWACG
jgi:uncharacterized protein YwqG